MDLLRVAFLRSRSIISTFCPFNAMDAAIFMVMNVFPALGLNEVTMIASPLLSLPSIMSRLVLSTLNASLMTFLLPFLTTTRQFWLSNLCLPMLARFLWREDFICGISERNGMLSPDRSFLLATVVSIILLRNITANGIPIPRMIATSKIIILLGETGDADPVGDMISLVLLTFTRLAISFSSLFWSR